MFIAFYEILKRYQRRTDATENDGGFLYYLVALDLGTKASVYVSVSVDRPRHNFVRLDDVILRQRWKSEAYDDLAFHVRSKEIG